MRARRPGPETQHRKLALHHMAERKRLGVLCNSSFDGHFRKKFPAKAQLPRVYLVTEIGSLNNLSLLSEHATTVGCHQNSRHPWFLCGAHRRHYRAACLQGVLRQALQRLYQARTLQSTLGVPGDPESEARSFPNPLCSLLTFNGGAIKKAQSVREVFVWQLMQVQEVSGKKAAALGD